MNPLPKIVRRVIVEIVTDSADYRTVRLCRLALALWPELYRYDLLRMVAGFNPDEADMWQEAWPLIGAAFETAMQEARP